YSEINFGIGLLLGIIGFSAAILGGLTNVYGAILGGFLFAALQTVGAVMLPMLGQGIPSAYKDVFAFAVVIILLAWKPSGLIAERVSERVYGLLTMRHTLKGSRALLLVSLAIVFIFAWGMLHAETEQEVGLMIGVSVVLVLAARWLRVTPPLATSINAYPGALGVGCVVGTLLLVAAFFDNHFALLLICTVLLYSIAGFGLNIQFGYCGVLNFAGAAFFGIGSYTAA